MGLKTLAGMQAISGPRESGSGPKLSEDSRDIADGPKSNSNDVISSDL